MANKLILKGLVYDTDSSESVNKLLDNKDVIAGDGIEVEIQSNENVKITSDIGIKIIDGIPCAVYAVAEEEV